MPERVSSFDFGISFVDGTMVEQGQAIVRFLSPFFVETENTLHGLEEKLDLKFVVRKIDYNHEYEVRRGTPCKAIRKLSIGERSIFLEYKIIPDQSTIPSVSYNVVIVLKNKEGRTVGIPEEIARLLS